MRMIFVLGAMLFCNSVFAMPVQEKIERMGTVDLLLYFKGSANLQAAEQIKNRNAKIRFVHSQLIQAAEQSQAVVINFLKKSKVPFRPYYVDNVILVPQVNLKLYKSLQNFAEIGTIREDVSAKLEMFPVKPVSLKKNVPNMPSSITALRIDKVWNELGVRGKGIVIAGQDTGYYWEHNALKKHYRGYNNGFINHNYNWFDAIAGSAAPNDDLGHGTHTMGTMVGDDGNQNIVGVAPEAQWIGCKNMQNDVGSVSSYLSCMEFLLAPYPHGGNSRKDGKPELAPHILNNSWSCSIAEGCKGDELLGAVQAFRAAGIFFVVAVGNGGPNCKSVAKAPAMYASELFSVGSYNRVLDEIAFFSSRGPSNWNGKLAPNLIALGDLILSSDIGNPDKYTERIGTSMASPQVAGVVALLWSARPELIGQIERTTEILQKSAKPVVNTETCGGLPVDAIPNASAGYGMLDAYGALTFDK